MFRHSISFDPINSLLNVFDSLLLRRKELGLGLLTNSIIHQLGCIKVITNFHKAVITKKLAMATTARDTNKFTTMSHIPGGSAMFLHIRDNHRRRGDEFISLIPEIIRMTPIGIYNAIPFSAISKPGHLRGPLLWLCHRSDMLMLRLLRLAHQLHLLNRDAELLNL